MKNIERRLAKLFCDTVPELNLRWRRMSYPVNGVEELPFACIRPWVDIKNRFLSRVALIACLGLAIPGAVGFYLLKDSENISPASALMWFGAMVLSSLVASFVHWVFWWPHPSLCKEWENAREFALAVGYVEDAIGKPVETWDDLDQIASDAVRALTVELRTIDQILGTTSATRGPNPAFIQWKEHCRWARQLLDGVPEYTRFPVPEPEAWSRSRM